MAVIFLIDKQIRFVILQNKQGRTRLSKWYIDIDDEEKVTNFLTLDKN